MEADHRNEVIRRAAQCLADDPTFSRLSGAEQFKEAEAVLAREKGVAPGDAELVADVLLAVLEAAPTPPPVIPPRVRHVDGKEVVDQAAVMAQALEAAQKGAVTISAPKGLNPNDSVALGVVSKPFDPPVFTPPPPTSARPTFKAKAPKPVNDMPLLKVYKEATGASDAVVAHVVMIPRSTVQAICSGRVQEALDARQRHALRQSLEAQKMKIDAAIAAI